MAWIDNRAWSHPKVVDLSDRAFRVWVNSICYASGYLTEGKLTRPQQVTVGATPKIRSELERAGLWETFGPDVVIHDWDDHNGDRDRRERLRREKDAARKREERAAKRGIPPDCPGDSPPDSPNPGLQDVQAVTVDCVTSESKSQDLCSNEVMPPLTLENLQAMQAQIGRTIE